MRILLVDDDPLVRRDTARLLRRTLGHEVEQAGGVAAALAVAGRGEFDLVLTDFLMPGGTGADLATRLRKAGFRGRIACYTGTPDKVPDDRSFEAVLVKPVGIEELRRLLRC
jgi:CheY-like chemotaxis protein